MTSLLPVLSVSGLLLLGFAVGKILPPSVLRQMLKPLPAVVLLLLFLMGAEFGGIFTDKALGKVSIAVITNDLQDALLCVKFSMF